MRSLFKTKESKESKETETNWDGEPSESDLDSDGDWEVGFAVYGSNMSNKDSTDMQ